MKLSAQDNNPDSRNEDDDCFNVELKYWYTVGMPLLTERKHCVKRDLAGLG